MKASTAPWQIARTGGRVFGTWGVNLHALDGTIHPLVAGFSSESAAGEFMARYLAGLYRPSEETDADKTLREYAMKALRRNAS